MAGHAKKACRILRLPLHTLRRGRLFQADDIRPYGVGEICRFVLGADSICPWANTVRPYGGDGIMGHAPAPNTGAGGICNIICQGVSLLPLKSIFPPRVTCSSPLASASISSSGL